MFLNDADRVSESKKDEDAYTVQRPFNRMKPKDNLSNNENNNKLVISHRREENFPKIIHNARTITQVILANVKGCFSVLKKSQMTKGANEVTFLTNGDEN